MTHAPAPLPERPPPRPRRVLDLGRASLVLTACLLVPACFSAPRYEGPVSKHFDGQTFLNQTPTHAPDALDMVRYGVDVKRGRWAEWSNNKSFAPPPARVGLGGLRVTFINHATTLIQMDGLNILTDPIWSARCSPVRFAGPSRVRDPGVKMQDLPAIDVVLISHNHYDHFDMETLRALSARNPGLRIITGLGNDRQLALEGIPGGQAIDWQQEVELSDAVTLVGWPAQHFSGRGLGDRNATLWLSYVLLGSKGPVYFAGDTGFGPHFEAAGETHGPFRLAILPIGAYLPRWFMAPIHIDPEQAVQAALLLKAKVSLGVHFGTFPLAADGQHTPVYDLREALNKRSPKPNFWVLQFGQGRAVPPL